MKKKTPDSGENFENIRMAMEERDRFLKEHPQLIPFQEEIERRLKDAERPVDRMIMLFSMMAEKLSRIREAYSEIEEVLEDNH